MMLINVPIIFNKNVDVVIGSLAFFVASISLALAEDSGRNGDHFLNEFNVWASALGPRFSFESLKENLAEADEYVIVAELSTHPLSIEVVSINHGKETHFRFVSTRFARAVNCSVKESSFDAGFANGERLSAINVTSVEAHPFYTLVEKKKNEKVQLYSFGVYFDSAVRKEIDPLQKEMLSAMLRECSEFKVTAID